MTVVLYGATGYTGVLVTDELVRRGAPFVLAGRNREKLERSGGRARPGRAGGGGVRGRARLAAPGPGRGEGGDQLRRPVHAGRRRRGPGRGRHRHPLPRLHRASRPTSSRSSTASAPRPSGAAWRSCPPWASTTCPATASPAWPPRGSEPLAKLTLAYAVKGFGMSRGTLRSGLEMMKGGDVVYERGDWRPAPFGIFRANFDFSAPIGRQAMTRYPSGEVITAPRHTDVAEVVSLITTRGVAPGPGGAGAAVRAARPGADAAHPPTAGARPGRGHAARGAAGGRAARRRVHDRGRGARARTGASCAGPCGAATCTA